MVSFGQLFQETVGVSQHYLRVPSFKNFNTKKFKIQNR